MELEDLEDDLIPTFNENVAYFNEMIDLCKEDNWDSEGSANIEPETATNGIAFIQFCECLNFFKYDMYPNNNGTISFEWQYDIGNCYFEIGKTKGCFYYHDGIKEVAEPHESSYGLVDNCYDVIKNFIPESIEADKEIYYNNFILNDEI